MVGRTSGANEEARARAEMVEKDGVLAA